MSIAQFFQKTLFVCVLAGCCLSCENPNANGGGEVNPPDTTVTNPKDTVPVEVVDTTLYDCDALCTPSPSPETQKVYRFLRQIYGRKMLSGAMACVNWNVNEAEWVHYHTGKYPATTCFDLIQATMTDQWAKNTYASYAVYEDWWKNHGLVQGMWHFMVPKTESATTTSSSATYKPEETTFRAVNVPKEGTWEHTLFVENIDIVAKILQGFQERHIPVIWRPFHEAAGGWFWWGKDAEAEVWMWRYMYDRFVNHFGLNNLIWVWTTQGSDAAWYPGDEYVDIVARDLYKKSQAQSSYSYFAYDEMMYSNKMLALSECGSVAPIGEQWEAGAKWLYFMPWYDTKRSSSTSPNSIYFTDTTTPHEHAPIEWWKAAWEQPNVLSRDDMPSFAE